MVMMIKISFTCLFPGSHSFSSVKTETLVPSLFFAGPFISVVLSKLENMLENSLHVNLLLIGIITQLASYPQPLLRSFLLNTNMVFQPSVRSLYQVFAHKPYFCLLERYFWCLVNSSALYSFTCCFPSHPRASHLVSVF